MKIIGLTGPSGSGKSTISHIAKELGYYVINCDKISFEISNKKETLEKLENSFNGVVTNGILDRKKLAKKAFSTPQKTNLLNEIMLPLIVKKTEEIICSAQKSGYELFLLDAPTLFESGLDAKCNDTIAVLADEKTRAERLTIRDGLSSEQLKNRLKASKSEDFFKEKTGHIIYNNGNLSEYKKSAEALLITLKQE